MLDKLYSTNLNTPKASEQKFKALLSVRYIEGLPCSQLQSPFLCKQNKLAIGQFKEPIECTFSTVALVWILVFKYISFDLFTIIHQLILLAVLSNKVFSPSCNSSCNKCNMNLYPLTIQLY